MIKHAEAWRLKVAEDTLDKMLALKWKHYAYRWTRYQDGSVEEMGRAARCGA